MHGWPVVPCTVGWVSRSETHHVGLCGKVVRCDSLHAPYSNCRFTNWLYLARLGMVRSFNRVGNAPRVEIQPPGHC